MPGSGRFLGISCPTLCQVPAGLLPGVVPLSPTWHSILQAEHVSIRAALHGALASRPAPGSL